MINKNDLTVKHTDLHYLLNFVKHSDQFILLFNLFFLFVVEFDSGNI